MSTRDLNNWKPRLCSTGNNLTSIQLSTCGKYFVAGGEDIFLFDTIHYIPFWKLELNPTKPILELRPVSDMCVFRAEKKGWCAISLLKSHSTGGVKSTTVSNYEGKTMDQNDVCIVDKMKKNNRF
jgi:hypothetical protein